MPETSPFADSYWVIPAKFLAGEYPGSQDDRLAAHKIQRLLAAGINLFIDLTCENDARPYAPLLLEEASLLGHRVQHERYPIMDYFIPEVEEMKAILDRIDAALAKGEKVYIHCLGGIGRTGTVVGCYLVRHGMRSDEALETIARLRKDVPDWWRPSPETETQRNFIHNWRPGQ